MLVKYLVPAIVILLITWSCKKDFLDKQPLDAISKATFWKTEDDVKMGLAACYARMNNDYTGQSQWGSGLAHWDGITDNGNTQYSWEGNFTNVAKGQIESTTGGVVSGMWSVCYSGIATCNIFLANIGSVSSLTTEKINIFKSEVLVIRAFWYDHLTMLYGDCPLILTVPTAEEAKQLVRTPKSEILTQILKDLDEAIGYLPDEGYNGSIVKATAQALKARICLYNEKWAEAAQVAKAVLDNQKFVLSPGYRDLFSGPAQKTNKEILFSVKYLAPSIWHGMTYIHNWWFSLTPLSDLIDCYEKLPGWDPDQPYEKRDPRMRLSYYFDGDPFSEMKGGVFNAALSGSKTAQGLSKFADKVEWTYLQDDQDIVLIRLADVKLMYAEAMFMDGKGNDASALSAVNDVRGRFGDALPPLTALTQDAIRYERRVELAFEGLRYYDIKRWKIAHIVMNNLKDPVASDGKYSFTNPKHYLWPIPQVDMDVMGSAFVQNPGY